MALLVVIRDLGLFKYTIIELMVTRCIRRYIIGTSLWWELIDPKLIFRRDASAPEIAPGSASLWWSTVVSDFVVLPPSQLPSGVYYGVSFSTFAINTPKYLEYLHSTIEALGGTFIRARLPTVDGLAGALVSAQELVGEEFPIFVNATGIGAKYLVNDEAVGAVKGQSLLVKGEAKHVSTRLDKANNQTNIVIPRPGAGASILGVTREPGIWNTHVDDVSTMQILEGCKDLAPDLLNQRGDFDVLSVQVGLRPSREGGPRVELEILRDGTLVVHEYGHSGAG